jgi:hypothetical protein
MFLSFPAGFIAVCRRRSRKVQQTYSNSRRLHPASGGHELQVLLVKVAVKEVKETSVPQENFLTIIPDGLFLI